jgi:hypothetical protein
MLVLLICLFKRSADPRDHVFSDLAGEWTGHVTSSPSDSSDKVSFANVSANFEISADGNHISFILKNGLENGQSEFFLKKAEGIPLGLFVTNIRGEDLGEVHVSVQRNSHTYALRGLLRPKNDQITAQLEGTSLSIAITDQFSSNVTLMAFNQEERNALVASTARIGLVLTVIVAIIVAMYKVADLGDVIKPEDAQITDKIRAKSRADSLKKAKGGPDGKKKTE